MPYADPAVAKAYLKQYLASYTPEQVDQERERKRVWARSNPDVRKAHYRKNIEKYQAYERNRQYVKTYGITLADYNAMFERQGGVCAICRGPQKTKSGRLTHLSVDHCHESGKVRGLLCMACNHLLGRYEKHRDAMLSYLEGAK